jgi:hypothetical protein
MIKTYIVYDRNPDGSATVEYITDDVSEICNYAFMLNGTKLLHSYFDNYNIPTQLIRFRKYAVNYKQEESDIKLTEAVRLYSIKQILK